MRDHGPIGFDIDPDRLARRLLWICVAIVGALVFLDATVNYARWTEIGAIRRLFNMTREDALGSWFGVTLTGFVALTAWTTVIVVARTGTRGWRLVGWIGAALFLSWMAVDDGAEIHERIGTAFDFLAERNSDTGGTVFGALERFPSYTWQFVLLPFFAVMGVLVLGFVGLEVDDRGLRTTIAAAFVLLATAVGLDFVEGLDETHRWNAYTWVVERWDVAWFTETTFRQSPYETLRHFSKSIEEALEIVAMTLLWTVLLRHLGRRAPEVRLRATKTR